MIIYPDTTVYILCPANFFTGGPTLLHQLGSQLTVMGINVKMLYLFGEGVVHSFPVAREYKKYHLDWTTSKVLDDEKNIIIFYETIPFGITNDSKIRKIFWWLSVDNYILKIREALNNIDISKVTIKELPRIFYFGNNVNITHWCQSEYARQFILCNGVQEKDINMVSDYLEDCFFSGEVDLTKKKNIVVFNPNKGWETTKKLMELRSDITWRPIQNMTPDQVRELLSTAKVYIDFGHHPGKDRIPREAAMSGCVIITGLRGSAANDLDIRIPQEFKIRDDNIEGILRKVDGVFADFTSAYKKQAGYRDYIREEKNIFIKEIIAAFEIDKNNFPVYSAVLNDKESYGIDIIRALSEMETPDELKFIIDDRLANPNFSSSMIYTEQERRYLTLPGINKVEILTSTDADFLYTEGRIKKIYVKDNGEDTDVLIKKLSAVKKSDLFLV